MEQNTLIAGLIALAICLLPFVLVNRSRKIKERQLALALKDIALQNNGQIDMYDTWGGNTAIGFDAKANAISFYKNTKNHIFSCYILLAQVQECQVLSTHKILQEKESTYEVIYKLELLFTLEDPSEPPITLEFYNKDYDSLTPSGEKEIIEKWFKKVQEGIGAV